MKPHRVFSPDGAVSLDAGDTTARFTLAQGDVLDPATACTATLSGVMSPSDALPLTAPFVWSFTAGTGQDATQPRPGPTLQVPTNTAIRAVFSEGIAADTLDDAILTPVPPNRPHRA